MRKRNTAILFTAIVAASSFELARFCPRRESTEADGGQRHA